MIPKEEKREGSKKKEKYRRQHEETRIRYNQLFADSKQTRDRYSVFAEYFRTSCTCAAKNERRETSKFFV